MKFADVNVTLVDAKSHPSRGAWIEITPECDTTMPESVAPLTGCVD